VFSVPTSRLHRFSGERIKPDDVDLEEDDPRTRHTLLAALRREPELPLRVEGR